MAEFGIAPEKVKRHTEEFDRYAGLLTGYADQTRGICSSLSQLGGSTNQIKSALRIASERMFGEQRTAKNLGAKLIEIIAVYEMTEKKICDHAGSSIAFQDPEGMESGKTEAGTNDASEDDGGMLDYILDALKQALFGDFVDDSNLLGTVLNIAIGFVPYVGQAADIRDLVADIIHLVDDGPTTEEWVDLGFTLIGIIPGIGDVLKHGDEAGDAVKALLKNFDNADEAADAVKNLFKRGDDVFSAVGDKLDHFSDLFEYNVLDKLDDFIDSHPTSKEIKNMIDTVKDTVKNNKIYQDVDHILDTLEYTKGKFEISAKEFIEELIDNYKEDFEKSVLVDLMDRFGAGPQAEPAT